MLTNIKLKTVFRIFLIAIHLSLSSLFSKGEIEQDSLSQKEKQQVIFNINELLKKNYIFPEMANKMQDTLLKNLHKGVYSSISDPILFAQKLTNDLQSVSKDVHIVVNFNPNRVKELKMDKPEKHEISASRLKELQLNNFGFKKVELLGGNIGYMDLESFADARYGTETAIAAMNFLANTSALIIDLRNNGGGDPSMTRLIASYLFSSTPVHLNTFYNKPANTYTESWTYANVSGKRNPDIDVYILTSNNTFSAAEDFAYDLKNLKRAVIIGETTGGGAHTGSTMIADDQFTVFIPTGRGINPVTKTDWEGVGVKPDIEVPASTALNTAQVKALENLISKSGETNNIFLKWPLASLKAKLNPVKIDEDILKSYAGNYGPRIISYSNGNLYYHRGNNPLIKMVPLESNLFELEGIEDFRLEFITKNDKVVALEGLYKDGEMDKNLKD